MSGHEAPSGTPARSLQPNLSFGDWIKSTPYLWITQLFAVLGFFASGIYYTFYVISSGRQSLSPTALIKINAWIHIPLLLVSAAYLIHTLDDNKAGKTRTGFLWKLLSPAHAGFWPSIRRDKRAHGAVRSFKYFFVVFILCMLAYYSWTVFSETKAVNEFEDKVIPYKALFATALSDYLSYVLNTIGGLALLGSFLQLWSPGVVIWPAMKKDGRSPWQKSGRKHRVWLITAAVVSCLGPALVLLYWTCKHEAISKEALLNIVIILNWLSGAFNAVAMMLLISRLDSKLIGLQSSLVGVLYAYAAVQTLFAAFPPESMEVVKALTLYLVLIFKVYFFFIIHFALTQGRILCYMVCAPQLRNRKRSEMKEAEEAGGKGSWKYQLRVCGLLVAVAICSIACMPVMTWAKENGYKELINERGISVIQLGLTLFAVVAFWSSTRPTKRMALFISDAARRWSAIFIGSKLRLASGKEDAGRKALREIRLWFASFIVVLTVFYAVEYYVQEVAHDALSIEAGSVRMQADPLPESDKGEVHSAKELVAKITLQGTTGKDSAFAFPITSLEENANDALDLVAVLKTPGDGEEIVVSSERLTFPKIHSPRPKPQTDAHDAHGSPTDGHALPIIERNDKYKIDLTRQGWILPDTMSFELRVAPLDSSLDSTKSRPAESAHVQLIRPEWSAVDTSSFQLDITDADAPPDTNIAYVDLRALTTKGKWQRVVARDSGFSVLEFGVRQVYGPKHKDTTIVIGKVVVSDTARHHHGTIWVENHPEVRSGIDTIWTGKLTHSTTVVLSSCPRRKGASYAESNIATITLSYGNDHAGLHHERIHSAGWTMVEVMLNNLSGLFLFLCFLELASPRTAKRFDKPRYRYGRLATWLFVSVSLLQAITFVSWTADHHLSSAILKTQLLVWQTVSGLVVAVTYALFIARFDSTLMWKRSFEVRCLFGYAAIQPLFVVFGIAGGIYESIKFITIVQALILKLWMVYVVLDALRNGALVTYLLTFPKLDRMANSVFRHGLLCRISRHEHDHLELEVYEYGELMLSGPYQERTPEDYEHAVADLKNVHMTVFQRSPVNGNWRLSLRVSGNRTLLGRHDFPSKKKAKKFEARFKRSIAYIKPTYE